MMTSRHSLNNLTKPLLEIISDFLDFCSFLSLKHATSYINKSLNAPRTWNQQLTNQLPPFLKVIIDEYLGADINIDGKPKFEKLFAMIVKIRECLEEIISKKNPSLKRSTITQFLMKSFSDSTNKQHLDHQVALYHEQFPPEAYYLYRFLNGESKLDPLTDGAGLFGGFSYYSKLYELRFISFSKPLIPYLQEMGIQPFLIVPVRDDYHHFIQIDTRNIIGLGKGALTSLIRKRVKPTGEVCMLLYIWKRGILSFLESIRNFSYDSRIDLFSHLDTLHRPLSDVTTKGIRIRANAYFSPWDLDFGMEKFVYAYQIRISDNGVKGRWKLVSTYWKITEGESQRVVEGKGVVGFFPEIQPGCEDFVYESCCPISEFTGTMSGHITFRNLATQEEINAIVGELKFNIPEGAALVEHDPLSFKFDLVHVGDGEKLDNEEDKKLKENSEVKVNE